jgi:hypothetical protein
MSFKFQLSHTTSLSGNCVLKKVTRSLSIYHDYHMLSSDEGEAAEDPALTYNWTPISVRCIENIKLTISNCSLHVSQVQIPNFYPKGLI